MDKPPIEDVLKHYGAGHVPEGQRWLTMRCPFHPDRSASARVNTEAAKFKCFACNVSGDAFDVVEWREGTRDFVSTKREVESILGYSLADVSRGTEDGGASGGLPQGSRRKRGQRTILSSRRRRTGPSAGA